METFVPIDSFSQLHSYSYSIIALQELNLNYFYSRVYWNCACLSIEATGIDDDSNVDENGDKKKKSSTDYGEVAKAIYKMKKYGVEVNPPSINDSDLDFTPDENRDSIMFGIGGIAKINKEVAAQIIENRPYTSFEDFYKKNSYKESLVKNQHFVQLIKAGCFDDFDKNRIRVMKQFIVLSTETKDTLELANLPRAIKNGVKIPKELLSPYAFKKYVCSKPFYYGPHPKFKSKKIYWLDERGLKYFNENCRNQMQEGVDWFDDDDRTLVVDKSLEKLFKPVMEELKAYIKRPEVIKEFNKALWREEYAKKIPIENVNKWSFEACSYYSIEHELAHADLERYNISRFSDLPEEPVFIEKQWGRSTTKTYRQYEISQIAGVVIDKSDTNHFFTILTPEDEVVNVNMNNGQYAYYKSQISDKEGKVVDKSWLSRGNLVVLSGYRRGDSFAAKRYKNSIYQHTLMKINAVHEDGSLDIISERYNCEKEEN